MKYQSNDKYLGTAYDVKVLNQELSDFKGGILARFEPNTYPSSATIKVLTVATGNNTGVTIKNRDGSVTYATVDLTALGTTAITLPAKLESGNDLVLNLDNVDGAITNGGEGGIDGEVLFSVEFSIEGAGGCVIGNPKSDDSTVFTPTPA